MAKKTVNNDVLLTNIIKGIEEVKGNDIDILDLREIDNAACDYFIICNGNSNTQVNAIVKFNSKNGFQIHQRQALACGRRRYCRMGFNGLCEYRGARFSKTHP